MAASTAANGSICSGPLETVALGFKRFPGLSGDQWRGRLALLALDELQAGMMLAADATHVTGRVLLRKGVCLSADHLRIFRQWGVISVDIEGVDAPAGVEQRMQQLDPERLAQLHERLQHRFRHADPQQPVIAELMRWCLENEAGDLAK